jgi:hypothetical protein
MASQADLASCSLIHCGLNSGKPFLHVIAHLGMREYVKLVSSNCSQSTLGYIGWIEPDCWRRALSAASFPP